jgi:hypothetical protein
MNLTRGFFRLWLVISLLWIAGSGWILRDNLRSDCSDVSGPHKPPTEMSDHELVCALASLPPPPAGFVLDQDPAIAGWNLRVRAAEWIALPPLGLLLLGCAIIWVGRGFRSPYSK